MNNKHIQNIIHFASKLKTSQRTTKHDKPIVWGGLNVDYTSENIVPDDDKGQAYIPYRQPIIPYTSTAQLCAEEV